MTTRRSFLQALATLLAARKLPKVADPPETVGVEKCTYTLRTVEVDPGDYTTVLESSYDGVTWYDDGIVRPLLRARFQSGHTTPPAPSTASISLVYDEG